MKPSPLPTRHEEHHIYTCITHNDYLHNISMYSCSTYQSTTPPCNNLEPDFCPHNITPPETLSVLFHLSVSDEHEGEPAFLGVDLAHRKACPIYSNESLRNDVSYEFSRRPHLSCKEVWTAVRKLIAIFLLFSKKSVFFPEEGVRALIIFWCVFQLLVVFRTGSDFSILN